MSSNDPINNIKFELSNIREQVNKVLEDTFSTGAASLPVDMYQNDLTLIAVVGPLLGLDTATLDIAITEGNQLLISGETHNPEAVGAEDYVRRERKFGKFNRAVGLPVAVVAEETRASFKNHVLTITMPKAEPKTGPKVIKVTEVE